MIPRRRFPLNHANVHLMLIFSLLAISGTLAAATETAGEDLIAHYPLDETSGEIAHDRSAHENHATLVNGFWNAGDGGSAPEFNGQDTRVTAPHQPYLNLERAFTFSAMVKLARLEGDHGFVSKGREHYASGYAFYQTNGRLALNLATTQRPGEGVKGRGYTLESDPVLTEREWTHVAVSYDSRTGQVKFYKNGEPVHEASAAGEVMYLPDNRYPYTTVDLSLSGMATFPHLYTQLEGFMREVKIYRVARSAEQIRQDYERVRHLADIALQTEADRYRESLVCELRFAVTDQATGEPLRPRVYVRETGDDGRYHLPPDKFSYGSADRGYFYLLDQNGEVNEAARLPEGTFDVTVVHGFEHEPVRKTVTLEPGQPQTLEVVMPRLVNLRQRGWLNGEHHVHYIGHGRREYDGILGPEEAAYMCAAEGMDYAALLLDGAREEAEREVGRHISLDGTFLGRVGSELTPSLGGHLCLVNVDHLPQRDTAQFSNMQAIRESAAQGGIAVYTHPTSGIDMEQIGASTHSREMPVAVALEAMPIWDVAYGGLRAFDHVLVEDWYRYLNLGFRLAAGASTDVYLNNPVLLRAAGSRRTYVQVDEPSWEAIVDGYREGRTFITNGPLLLIEADGEGPGGTVRLEGESEQRVELAIEAYHHHGVDRVEIVHNGEVVRTLDGQGESTFTADAPLSVEKTGWLAARVHGRRGDFFGTRAHTSPVYLQYADEPIQRRQADVDYFVQWLDDYRRFIPAYSAYRGLSEDDAQPLYDDIERAKAVFESLAP